MLYVRLGHVIFAIRQFALPATKTGTQHWVHIDTSEMQHER
jgi:hypothetical protein